MGIGMREVMGLLIVVPLVVGLVALLLPRKWVSVRIKRWILGAWVVVGVAQFVEGVLSRAGAQTMLDGISEVLIFGAGFLILAESPRWKTVVGWLVVFVGIVFMVAAGTMRHG